MKKAIIITLSVLLSAGALSHASIPSKQLLPSGRRQAGAWSNGAAYAQVSHLCSLLKCANALSPPCRMRSPLVTTFCANFEHAGSFDKHSGFPVVLHNPIGSILSKWRHSPQVLFDIFNPFQFKPQF